MMGIFALLVALLGLVLGQPWEFGYPCSIANCAAHCMTNLTMNHIPCANYDWGCLCYSDTFLHYIEACALDNCTKLECSGAFCEVAKSCSSVSAPMTFGPYSTAVTIDDPRTYPTIWTEDMPTSLEPLFVMTSSSAVSTGSHSVVRTMTSFNSTPSTVSITVTLPPDEGPVVSHSSGSWLTSATGQQSAIPSSIEVSAEQPSSIPFDTLTTSSAAESLGSPPRFGNHSALPISVNSTVPGSGPPFGNMTASRAASDMIASPNTTSTGPPVSNSSASTAPTLSKKPHESSASPPITSFLSGTASGLETSPDETGSDHDSSSKSNTRSTLTVSAAITTATSTEGGAVTIGQSVYGVTFSALVAVGVLMVGL